MVTTRADDGRIEVEVADTGPGVAPAEREKVLEPLYSTKNFGVGLGLPIVKQIIELHGGGLDIRGDVDEGARMVLWLPVESAERRAAS